MAFNSNNFRLGRGEYLTDGIPAAPWHHAYESADDTLDEITTVGYFPTNFGYEEGMVKDGDFIIIKSSDGTCGGYFISEAAVTPSLGTNTLVQNAVSESVGSIDISFEGPFTGSPQVVTAEWIKQGGQITLTIPSFSATFSGGADKINSLTILPEVLVPNVGYVVPMNVLNNSVFSAGLFDISGVTGLIQIGTYAAGNNFTAGTIGWSQNSIVYSTYS